MLRTEILEALETWIDAWNEHDLDAVLWLLHDDVVFENWDGHTVAGKRELRRAWTDWFENHGIFRFITEEIFIDMEARRALLMWTLEWPSKEKAYKGVWEKRCGVDVLHFDKEKIIRKLTYTKTSLEIEGKIVKLTASE